jgi:hypothetical protein
MKIVIASVVGFAVGLVAHDPLRAWWVRRVYGLVRVIQHRSPTRQRAAAPVPAADPTDEAGA